MDILQELLDYFGLDKSLATELSLPTPSRLSFQEEILSKLEPNILFDPDLNLPGMTQLSRLQAIFSDYGIPASIETIQGLCPQSSSISHLISLLSLLNPPLSIPSLESNITLISNNPQIFEKSPKLFLSTFPPKFSGSSNIVQELSITLEYWKQEFKRISVIFPKGAESEPPSVEMLKEYQKNVDAFGVEIKGFRKEYQENMQKFMTEGYQDGESIGKWSRVCVASYEKIEKMLGDIESIWSSINVLVNR